jgi:hypothetical protein
VRRRDGIEEKATRKFTEFFCNYSGRREQIQGLYHSWEQWK